jgi:serine/threonine-protein kinase
MEFDRILPVPVSALLEAGPAPSTLVGQTIGYCRLTGELGGSSAVYRAESQGGPCALEVVPKATAKGALEAAQTRKGLEHPNLARVLDAGEERGFVFVVLEAFEGRSVRELLKEKQKLPESEAVAIVSQTARALEALAGAGVAHRSVMPEHILVGADGAVKVLGVATSEVTHYMAPELGRGGAADVRSDLFSLGVTFHEMLAGARPWDADHPVKVAQAIQKDPPPPLDGGASEEVAAVVTKLLEKKPEDRYADANELVEALPGAKAKKSSKPTKKPLVARKTRSAPAPEPDEPRGGSDTTKYKVVIAILVLIIIGLAAALVLTHGAK